MTPQRAGANHAADHAGAALEAGDLAALGRALERRRQALESGETPTVDIFESGQRLLRALMAFQQRLAYESARLGQIERYVQRGK